MPKSRVAIVPCASALCAAGVVNIVRAQQSTAKDDAHNAVTVVDNCAPQPVAKPAEQKPPERHSGAEWSNWALVAVGFLTLGAVWIQAVESRKASTAARTAAEAALLNAQAVVDSERAWVVEKIRFPNELPRQPISGPVIVAIVVFELTNKGKTPAKITNVRLRFHLTELQEKLLPVPQYNTTSLRDIGVYGRMLIGDSAWSVEKMLEGQATFTSQDQLRIESGLQELYAYGGVDYETMGKKCFTQFCYVWYSPRGLTLEGDVAGFRKGGPDEYNRNT
jgi:hypothetical protein